MENRCESCYYWFDNCCHISKPSLQSRLKAGKDCYKDYEQIPLGDNFMKIGFRAWFDKEWNEAREATLNGLRMRKLRKSENGRSNGKLCEEVHATV